jgi:FtsP/CotA-like multicopper oxidase with cupredoxin domain
MTVTHTDGFPVAATRAEAVLLGMGERVDALVTMPDTAVPVLGIAEGKGGAAHVLLQPGTRPFDGLDRAVTAVASRPVVLGDTGLKAAESAMLPARTPEVVHDLVLAGPQPRYRWMINGATYDPELGLPVNTGQRLRLRIRNDSTMYHPMHVHGHTFQVVHPDRPGPRKDTVIVLPGRTVEVDLDADNPGQWLTHCHNAYHGEAGMMTVLSYIG